MKKIFFITISIFIITNSFGQSFLNNKNVKSFIAFNTPQKKVAATFNKTSISDWYSPIKYAVVDSVIGDSLKYFIGLMQYDSLAKIVYSNGTIDHNQWLSAGRVLDPKDTIISYTNNPQQKLSNYTSYTLDSIRFTYAYVRNTDSLLNGTSQKFAVVDTLFISYFKGQEIQKYSFANTLNKYALVNWKGDSIRVPINYFAVDTILLTKNDSTGIANIGSGFENFINIKSFVHKAPAGLSFNSIGGNDTDNLIAYTFTFKSGIQTVIGTDTAIMLYQKNPSTLPLGTRRTNYFGFYYAQNQDTVSWQNPTYYNTSLLAPWWCAYTPSNSWYGFVSGNAYTNEYFIDADFYLRTSANAGVSETKNNDFSMSTLFPNPVKVNEKVFITFNFKIQSYIKIEVYNLMGQLVKTLSKNVISGETIIDLNLEGINAGMYFVNLSACGFSQTKKLSIVE